MSVWVCGKHTSYIIVHRRVPSHIIMYRHQARGRLTIFALAGVESGIQQLRDHCQICRHFWRLWNQSQGSDKDSRDRRERSLWSGWNEQSEMAKKKLIVQ
jgi:hypothetical protein